MPESKQRKASIKTQKKEKQPRKKQKKVKKQPTQDDIRKMKELEKDFYEYDDQLNNQQNNAHHKRSVKFLDYIEPMKNDDYDNGMFKPKQRQILDKIANVLDNTIVAGVLAKFVKNIE